ncbi:MAG: TIGR00730 family Rossman fold protein [Bacteroidia bacterium]
MGQVLADSGRRLVYGAGNIGLMGILADAALAHGGEVVGVIPHFLMAKEVGHRGLSELIITDTMHARKARMAGLSDGFVAMPGGYGTMDELCEILTWAQLGLHGHPIGLLNTAGYFDGLLRFFDDMTRQGFLRPQNRDMILVHDQPAALLAQMTAYRPPQVEKWLDPDRL